MSDIHKIGNTKLDFIVLRMCQKIILTTEPG